MGKNGKIVVGVIAVAVIGYLVFMTASWGLFCMKVGEHMKNLNRFATTEQVLAIPNQVKDYAQHYHVMGAENITTDLLLEGRTVQGDVIMYFVVINVHNGSKSYKDEARVESQAALCEAGNRKRLEEIGMKFKNCPGG